MDDTMPGKLHIKTFGCQMNEYDSAKMAEVLGASRGCILTEQAEEADVLLLNTCSVREKAQDKVFSQLGRWRELKRRNGALPSAAAGGTLSTPQAEVA